MNGVSTLTQKGQVAIPKPIRDYFKLKPFDKVSFEVKDNAIVARPLLSVEQMRGILKPHRILTKKEYRKIIRDAVIKKFRKSLAK